MNSIYQAWDVYVDGTGSDEMAFKAFAEPFLTDESKSTPSPLNSEQAGILVDIIDSFVDEAHERHRRDLGDSEPERAVARELSEELRADVFTRDEIDAEISSGKQEFAGLSPDEIRDRLETRNRFFRLFKTSFLDRCGSGFGDALKPYLSKDERTRAEEVFSTPVDANDRVALKSMVEDMSESDDYVDLVSVQSQMARGSCAEEMLAISEEIPAKTGAPPRCLTEGLSGRLLSKAEKLFRKLTAVEFLLARMSQGEDDVSVLPFVAVGAARYAYDWVTERKATLQLVELGSALKDLDPSEFEDAEGKEVRE